jgi:DNA-binding response OmpR family regulator
MRSRAIPTIWWCSISRCRRSTVSRCCAASRSPLADARLILTARDTLEDRVAGLDLGADDYLTKPFDLPEFEARVRALIARTLQRGGSMLHGRLRFDTAARPALSTTTSRSSCRRASLR